MMYGVLRVETSCLLMFLYSIHIDCSRGGGGYLVLDLWIAESTGGGSVAPNSSPPVI